MLTGAATSRWRVVRHRWSPHRRRLARRLAVIAVSLAVLGAPLMAAEGAVPPAASKAIQARYTALGGASGVLGAATSEVTTVPKGYLRTFAHGRIYYSSGTGAHEILAGPMLTYYLKTGADSGSLGLPTGAPFDGGKSSTAQSFVKGRIYYAKTTGAHPVFGTTLARYLALDGARGVLGLPTVGSLPAKAAGARVSQFQGGRIWASAATGTREVLAGPVLSYYLKAGADGGSLGLPVGFQWHGAKSSTAQTFQKGRLYYAKATGAHPVYGTTLARYVALGGAGGALGLPTVGSLPSKVTDVRVTRFQSGRIYSGEKVGGVREVVGAINSRYSVIGAEGSWIGLPTALAKKTSYGSSQSFAHAQIHYYSSTGTAQVRLAFSTSVKTPKAADVPYTYRSGCPVGPSSLRMITLTYRNFAGDDVRGTIVVRSTVVSSITSVFADAHHAGWPFRRVTPVDTYKGSDVRSMEADNTSAFNCRKVTGNPYRVSQHSYGNAIDINTYENPYVANGKVYPKGSDSYLNRKNHRKGMILSGGTVASRFAAMGWPWGARWNEPDYQHFSSNGG
jgi:uncharacterized protein with LGFP repeats